MTDGVEGARLPARARGRSYVRFSAKVARAVCRRVAQGEALLSICAEPGMPHRVTVGRWVAAIPVFARKLALARQAAGWTYAAQPGPVFCEDAAAEIFARLCEGESLTRICRDPHLPALSTVSRWRLRDPGFDEAMRLARQIQGERLCDDSREIADAVEPRTAHATRVRLEHYRWMSMVLAPRRIARVRPMSADELDGGAGGEGGGGMTVIVQKFTEMEPGETLESLVLAQRARNAEAMAGAQAWLEQSRGREAERENASGKYPAPP